jgi:hypothetical protein
MLPAMDFKVTANMKLASILILLLSNLASFSQSDSTATGIEAICQAFNTKKEISSFKFYDSDSLPSGKAGYANYTYSYKTENKSNDIFYIKVWRDDENKNDQFYFINGNLIKAIITGYPLSPTTTFYLWNNNLIEQRPSFELFYKAFNQLGYCAFEKVKEHIYKKTK